jgi:hypothetical protein
LLDLLSGKRSKDDVGVGNSHALVVKFLVADLADALIAVPVCEGQDAVAASG